MVRLWKMLENTDISLVTNDKNRSIYASGPNYYSPKCIGFIDNGNENT